MEAQGLISLQDPAAVAAEFGPQDTGRCGVAAVNNHYNVVLFLDSVLGAAWTVESSSSVHESEV